ncbi:DUF1015 domain-containing protein [Candidatus Micrarchaeota archaeon]|nr:DUF1015 domain-containing protein [Candidatus Micrarchaeota archaeon]
MDDKLKKIGIQIPNILLPKNIDLTKWSVVACDQYTSEPEYWEQVKKFVRNDPSTLNIIYPEVYLEEPEEKKKERINKINQTMTNYLENILQEKQGFIYLERTVNDEQGNKKIRKGLMVCIDLEKYDYNKGSKSLVRATEGTVLERLPPRIEVRKDALLELPHIMVLIDDPDNTVIEPLTSLKTEKVYDFDLMMNGGHLEGYRINNEIQEKIIDSLFNLADKENFNKKYNLENEEVLLFAMGDGNHSLATAKAIWEERKKQGASQDDLARYALVELVNIHEGALEFEPIHRVIFNIKKPILEEMKNKFNDNFEYINCSKEEMINKVKTQIGDEQKIGFIQENIFGIITIKNPKHNLVVGTLQKFLDEFIKENAEKIDYVHGQEPTCELGAKIDNCGFFLPVIKKTELFKTVILEGALPRKTFSMGEAEEKRFYLECRKIRR